MDKQPKTNKFHEFLEKHRKEMITFNIVIWSVFAVLMIILANSGPDYITNEEMQQEVDKRCSNEIILPKEEGYKVRFDYNALLNTTFCEVIYNG